MPERNASLLAKLNALIDVKAGEWFERGMDLRAYSSGGTLLVNSGITTKGRVYFYRKWSKDFSTSTFVIGE